MDGESFRKLGSEIYSERTGEKEKAGERERDFDPRSNFNCQIIELAESGAGFLCAISKNSE